MRFNLIATALALSVISTSYAKVIYRDGDWQLDDTLPKKKEGICMAYTNVEAGRTLYQLELIKEKSKKSNILIQMRQQGKGASSWTLELKNGRVLAFANEGAINSKQNLMWHIPQNSNELIDQLIDRKDIRLKPADDTRDPRLEFSADGFKRVKDKMIEKCTFGDPLVDSDFEQSFLTKQDAINPVSITPEQVKELKRILAEGYKVHLDIAGNKNDMSSLRQKFSRELNEASSLKSLIERLVVSDIPESLRDIQNNDALKRQKEAELESLKSEIIRQTALVSNAEKTLSSARAAVAPLQNEHDNREGSAISARNSANSSYSRLQEIDSGINNSNARINALNNEQNILRNQLARFENDLNGRGGALDQSRRASDDFRNFRERSEVEERLRRDRGYDQARREVPGLDRALQSASSAVNDARGKLMAREAELKVCQASGVSLFDGASFRLPAQTRPNRNGQDNGDSPRGNRYNPPGQSTGGNGGGGRPDSGQPGRGGNGGNNGGSTTSTPSTPAPGTQPADCSAQQNAVTQAKSVVMSLEAQERTARQNLNQAQGRVDSIERRVQAEVEAMKSELGRRAQLATQRVNDLQAQMGSTSRRLDMIARNELPRELSIVSSLSNERPGVQDTYNRMAPIARNLEAELDQFEKRTNWNGKVQAVRAAEQDLDYKRGELSKTNAMKSSTENIIASCKNEAIRLGNQLTGQQTRKDQSERRLVEVNKSLEPFESERAKIEGRGADLQNNLAGLAVQFESQLPN